MKKYILCVPHGGFNDILNQINICLNYSIQSNRILLIDCSKNYILDFSSFFTINSDNIIYDNPTIAKILEDTIKNKKSIYPKILKNIITNYETKYNFKYKNFKYGIIPTNTLHQIRNLKNLENYDIIVHDACGGGVQINNILSIVQVKKNIQNSINEYLNTVEKPYLSIQVRNTDIKTDYINLFKKNEANIKQYKNIFLSTDSVEVFNYFKDKYNHKKIYLYTNLKQYNQPLHHEINHAVFFDTLRDIFLLLNGEELIIDRESSSGFTKLVHFLFETKSKYLFGLNKK